jgi:hypothetical protein
LDLFKADACVEAPKAYRSDLFTLVEATKAITFFELLLSVSPVLLIIEEAVKVVSI